MKKALTILILFTLVLSVVSPAFAETTQTSQPPIKFNDLGDYKWGRDAVDKMVAKGVIKGIGNNKFAPASPVTHGEVLAFLVRLIKPNVVSNVDEEYGILTIKYPEWEAKAIVDAYKSGIIRDYLLDYSDFDFDKPAKRYEIAEYLVRALKLAPSAYLSVDKRQPFSDWDSIPNEYKGFLYEAVREGLFKGDGKELKPLDNVKRIEVAVLLNRLEQVLINQEKNPSKEYLMSYTIRQAVDYGLPPEWVLAMIDGSGSNYNPKYKSGLPLGGYLVGVTGINSKLLPDIAKTLGIEYKEGMEFDPKTNIDMVINYLAIAYNKHQDIVYVDSVYRNGFEKADKLVDNNTLHQFVGEHGRILNERINEWKSRLKGYLDSITNPLLLDTLETYGH